MSIWCSWEEIGHNLDAVTAAQCAEAGIGYATIGDAPNPLERGEVRSYAQGFSNHYPTRDGEYEQPANINIAHIPVWCVPGHRDKDDGFDTVGEWVRLDVFTAEHSFTEGGKPTGRYDAVSIVLDETAARSLAADLLEWADLPKSYPKGEA